MTLSKRVRWWIASTFLLALLGMASYVVAAPYLAISGIRHVVAQGQHEQLWRYVDFDALRENVRPQLQQRIALGLLQRVGNRESRKNIAGVTALLAKPAVDAMSSPTGFATLLTGSSLANPDAGKRDEHGKPLPNDPLQHASTHFESSRVFTATVPNAEGQPVVFEFRRHGLSWKLVGLRLPE
ncbi:MAG: DUF2939 domain-containing protein [Xanthomonadaceae bacterium]|nr:DUF2939 domain-containing protein [Xanthomonadaceae bacterium]